jgi:TnpA family transposase
VPTAITGDMHSLNKVNFAILAWFGPRYEPRFTDLDKQIGQIYCAGNPARHAHCLIQPAGQVELNSIIAEKENIDRIVATLALKEMTQSTLVRKLCTYDADPTREAVFDYDKLVRSIYTLRYLRNPQWQRHVHRSQTGSSRTINCARPSHRWAARRS